MKIILKQDVKGLGRKEEIVNASDGYAKNYLIPRGIAVEATVGNVNEAKNKQQAAKDKKQRELEQAKEFAARLENKTVTIKARAGDSGKLFGAISGKDIADAIKSQYDAEVDKKKIVLHEPIKTAGEHQLEIRVYAGVTVNINVNIVI
ncbi:MAG: 50S ribosomal protein L9 [Clostridiales bacterium]|jgi:ribosomal protein L9|nr:50S ribosomal protein L9 [Clostridiales bacterium]